MARTALVTGGSRGIGAAISKALKAEGYSVAATYAGNDEAAAQFSAQTGISTYKWNVADYEASAAGIAKVEAELGPIDIVVANAGITRDAPFHKMTHCKTSCRHCPRSLSNSRCTAPWSIDRSAAEPSGSPRKPSRAPGSHRTWSSLQALGRLAESCPQ